MSSWTADLGSREVFYTLHCDCLEEGPIYVYRKLTMKTEPVSLKVWRRRSPNTNNSILTYLVTYETSAEQNLYTPFP